MISGEMDRVIRAVERIGKILGVLYVNNLGDVEVGTKASHLKRCGFSNTEIAELLGTTANSINVALHLARKRKQRPKRKAKFTK